MASNGSCASPSNLAAASGLYQCAAISRSMASSSCALVGILTSRNGIGLVIAQRSPLALIERPTPRVVGKCVFNPITDRGMPFSAVLVWLIIANAQNDRHELGRRFYARITPPQ